VADAYETVPYDDRPVGETHPDRLFAAARGAGLDAIDPTSARVLELGCAHAVNLMPIAAALPGAQLVGIDRSARQIALAQKRTREAGLANLDLRCADVMDLELGEQRYDYVIAHGLISWVPDSVRDRVLQLAHDALAPRGVVYLSYNTMPAWGVRGAVRRALLELVGDTTDERVQIERARAGLAWLTELRPFAGTAEDVVLHEELDGLRDKPDMYLLHEYLVPSSRPPASMPPRCTRPPRSCAVACATRSQSSNCSTSS
jgi:SAM-dependent methyltransferase